MNRQVRPKCEISNGPGPTKAIIEASEAPLLSQDVASSSALTLASLNHHSFLPPRHPPPTRSSRHHQPSHLRLRTTPPNDSLISLSHLHLRQQQDPLREPDADDSDPVVRFLRGRSSSSDPDPPIESKLSLQRNRRTSWLLSPTAPTELPPLDPEPVNETPSGGEASLSAAFDDDDLSGTVSWEVMRIARELPENMTIGDALEGFQGGKKLTEWEC